MYCSMTGPVCGRDLREYHSECSALANNVLVDYFNACNTTKPFCSKEVCFNQFRHRLPFNRCPFCGSVAYFIYDTNYFQNIWNETLPPEYTIKNLFLKHSLNVQTLNKQFRNFVTIKNCHLYTHLLIPGVVAVLMEPKYSADSQLAFKNYQFCQKELTRLILIIERQSPNFALQLPLGLLHFNRTIDYEIKRWSTLSLHGNGSLPFSNKTFNIIIIFPFIIIAIYIDKLFLLK